jgi:CO/xanthine dehydrogenase Mo-binding subunit
MVIGKVDEGFSHSDIIVDEWVLTSRQEHAYLEPEAAVGTIDPRSDRAIRAFKIPTTLPRT